MKICIFEKNTSAIIDLTGAELCSFKKDDKEYIWNADEKFWGKHGPLLFPVVGKFFEDKIKIGGSEYNMQGHGFLQDLQFEIIEKSKNFIKIETTFDEETLKLYPFKFKFTASYKINEAGLSAKYEIINIDDKKMLYGFGLHNGFFCLSKGDKVEDLYLDFKKPVTIKKPTRFGDSFMDFRERVTVIENESKLFFDDDWYPANAPVCDTVNFNEFDLIHKNSGKILSYRFSENFNLFNAWRMPNSPFICLEPWSSQVGVYPYVENLEDVQTIISLEANEYHEYSFDFNV